MGSDAAKRISTSSSSTGEQDNDKDSFEDDASKFSRKTANNKLIENDAPAPDLRWFAYN